MRILKCMYIYLHIFTCILTHLHFLHSIHVFQAEQANAQRLPMIILILYVCEHLRIEGIERIDSSQASIVALVLDGTASLNMRWWDSCCDFFLILHS
jgi:hypothetical protein